MSTTEEWEKFFLLVIYEYCENSIKYVHENISKPIQFCQVYLIGSILSNQKFLSSYPKLYSSYSITDWSELFFSKILIIICCIIKTFIMI